MFVLHAYWLIVISINVCNQLGERRRNFAPALSDDDDEYEYLEESAILTLKTTAKGEPALKFSPKEIEHGYIEEVDDSESDWDTIG
ncbi:hypothetical protein C8J57DRAFT_1507404 [Mycena rebaudengoi]|nr:hypothetical protein C8J57DRAFT_1507404 [Mycena rebaudengoi]